MNANVAEREARNTAGELDAAGTLTRYLAPLGRAAFAATFVVFAARQLPAPGRCVGRPTGCAAAGIAGPVGRPDLAGWRVERALGLPG